MSVEDRRRSVLGLAAAGLLAAAVAGQAAQAAYPVKYRSATQVYLDAGQAQGLSVGQRLRVLSAGEEVATLEVEFVAEQSASCRILSEKRPVRAGDLAVPMSDQPPPQPAPAPALPSPSEQPVSTAPVAPAPAAYSTPRRPWARASGGIALSYDRTWDDSPSHFDFEERTARLDLTLWELGGRPYSFAVRLRSRQQSRPGTPTSDLPRDESASRMYEMALRYEPPDGRFAWEVGRLGVGRFTGTGYLDGVVLRARLTPQLELGGFAGRRANPDGLNFSGDGQKYGAFLRFAPRGTAGNYDARLTLARETQGGEVSREYASLEGRLGSGSRFWTYGRAEVDLNNGWRQEAAGSSVQLSLLSLGSQLRLSDYGMATLSYDSRKNYWTADNRSVSDALFDKLLHQGLRAGLSWDRPRGFGVSANVGWRLREGDSPQTLSYGGSLRHGDLFGLQAYFDGWAYSTIDTEGQLVTARLGRRFAAGHQLDVSYGLSRYTVKSVNQNRSSQWFRFTARAEMGRGVSLLNDLEYNTGDDRKGLRDLIELGYRF
jgi:hypothetical protein